MKSLWDCLRKERKQKKIHTEMFLKNRSGKQIERKIKKIASATTTTASQSVTKDC